MQVSAVQRGLHIIDNIIVRHEKDSTKENKQLNIFFREMHAAKWS